MLNWPAIHREALDIFVRYLQIDTSNPPGNEKPAARFLGALCEAEGIETEAQDLILNEMGCRYGQGFLYSKPVPERDFRELLVNDRARNSTHATL